MHEKKVALLRKRLSEIHQELEALKTFRPSKQLHQFRRQLLGEFSYIKKQLVDLQGKSKDRMAEERIQRQTKANRNRSEKMKRTWRYLRSIRENFFPDKGLRELRTLLTKHREGLETGIDYLVWRNPSP